MQGTSKQQNGLLLSSPAPGSSSKRKCVSFGTVAVREYQQILDVKPPCTGRGPSIGLGWIFVSKPTVTIEKWEYTNHRQQRKTSLLLTSQERISIAKQNGCSDEAIKRNMKKVAQAAMIQWQMNVLRKKDTGLLECHRSSSKKDSKQQLQIKQKKDLSKRRRGFYYCSTTAPSA